MNNDSFIEWVNRNADQRKLSLDEVRSLAGIRPRRWEHLLAAGGPPRQEEAEEIATEAFGMYLGEAWTSPRYELATEFRIFLDSKGREEYRFPKLWPQVLGNTSYRTDDSSDTTTIAVFEEVLEADMDPDSW